MATTGDSPLQTYDTALIEAYIDPTQTECTTTYNTNAHGRTLVSLRTTPSPRHTHRHARTLEWQEPVFRADAQTSDMTVATHGSRRMMDPLVFFSFLSLFLWLYRWRAAKLNGGPNRQRKITTCQTTHNITVATLPLSSLSFSGCLYVCVCTLFFLSLLLWPAPRLHLSHLSSHPPSPSLPPTHPQAGLQHSALLHFCKREHRKRKNI